MEFGRFLLRLASRACQSDSKCERLKLDDRLEGFLRLVFIPALTKPYEPPKKVDPDAPDELEGSDSGSKRPSKELPAEGLGGALASGLQSKRASSKEAAAEAKNVKDAKEAAGKGAKGGKERQGSKASLNLEQEAPAEESMELPPEPPEPEFWGGFADDDDLEFAAFMAPRFWPEGYEREVADW